MKKNPDFNKSITDDWKTPKKIYDEIMKYGFVDCFPYQCTYDEFKREYYDELLFVNPPFSKLDKVSDWVSHQYINNNCTIVLLIPARTDTKYFHKLLRLKPDIIFIEGRLNFNDSKPAPFPTLLLIFDHSKSCTYSTYKYSRYG